MNEQHLALVREVHRKEIERLRAEGKLDVPEPPPIPHAELPELPRDHELCREWNTYRLHVADFLGQGFAGLWILVKGDKIFVGYGRWEHAYITALEKVLQGELSPPFLIHQIRADEPVSRIERLRSPWPHSPSPLAKTA